MPLLCLSEGVVEIKVNILGTSYAIEKKLKLEDSYLEENSFIGYCDEIAKKIVLLDLANDKDYKDETEDYHRKFEKECLRHEIIHAFLSESGLSHSSLSYGGAWAKNEEMVDWIAIQFPKILKAFNEVGCI